MGKGVGERLGSRMGHWRRVLVKGLVLRWDRLLVKGLGLGWAIGVWCW